MSIQSTLGTDDNCPEDLLEQAITDFREGRPVLVFDSADREGETDIIYPAGAVTARDVSRLRNDGGGLICTALSDEVCRAFSLPFAQDEIDHSTAEDHDLSYDDRSSFSIPVNHRQTNTGVTDFDRALTITSLAEAAAAPEETDFSAEFRSPGHVPLLRAAPGLLRDRRGHTELGVALAKAARCPPAIVVCEMLDDRTGHALDRNAARAYARRNGLVFIEGERLMGALSEPSAGSRTELS